MKSTAGLAMLYATFLHGRNYSIFILFWFSVLHIVFLRYVGAQRDNCLCWFFVARDSTLLSVAFPIHLCFAQQWQVKK
jgi:hypothetical protein